MRRVPYLLLLLATAIAAPPLPRPLLAVDSPVLVADDGDGTERPCGTGTRTACGKVTTYTCTQWKWVSTTLGGTVSPGGGGANAGYTLVCAASTTVEKTLYKDP